MYFGLHRKVIKCQHRLLMKETFVRIWWYKHVSLLRIPCLSLRIFCLFCFPILYSVIHDKPVTLPKLHCTQILGRILARTSGHNSYIYIKDLKQNRLLVHFFQLYLIIQRHNVVTRGETGYEWTNVISKRNCPQVLPWVLDWLVNGPLSSEEEFICRQTLEMINPCLPTILLRYVTKDEANKYFLHPSKGKDSHPHCTDIGDSFDNIAFIICKSTFSSWNIFQMFLSRQKWLEVCKVFKVSALSQPCHDHLYITSLYCWCLVSSLQL